MGRPLYHVFLSLYQSGIIPPYIDRITFRLAFSLRTALTNLEMFWFIMSSPIRIISHDGPRLISIKLSLTISFF